MSLWRLAAIVVAAFMLRVFLPWEAVFGNEYVSFVETDAWYHMRLVDALIREFPSRIWHDPYLLHPDGEPVNAGPMLDWLIAGTALVLGGGAPSQRLVDLVGAFVPPTLGALTVVPIYVLGRELFTAGAGLWAALLVAVMPGQLLARSVLGFADHHCLEVLLTVLVIMFVVLALRPGRTARGRRALAASAGLALGAYCLTWGGAVLLMLVLWLWVAVQTVVEWLAGGEPGDLVETAIVALGAAAIVVAPWVFTRPQFAYQVLAAAVAVAGLASAAAAGMAAKRLGWSRRATVVGAALAACACGVSAALAAPAQLASLATDLARVSPFRNTELVNEAQPLLASPLWRPVPLWKEFATASLITPFGLGLMAVELFTRRSRGVMLLFVWSLVDLAASFGQVRFVHYLGLNVALVAGHVSDRGLRGVVAGRSRFMRVAVAAAVALLLVAPGTPELGRRIVRDSALASGWHDALLWMSANTPEPFSTSDAYFSANRVDPGPSKYSVLAWWDYGYWITRIARRVPATNPRQTNVSAAAAFMLATDEVSATAAMQRLGSRYVVASWESQIRSPVSKADGFFGGIAVAGGRSVREYCGLYARADDAVSTSDAELYCYPSYFQTAAIRLYLYGGRAASPPGPVVVVASKRDVRGSVPVNVIMAEWAFPTYEDAVRFVEASRRADLRIVSKNLHETCVPLDAFASFTPRFRSLDREGSIDAPPLVQVFELRAR